MKRFKEIAKEAVKWVLSLAAFIAAGIVIMHIVSILPGMNIQNPLRTGGMTGFSAWATILFLEWWGKSKNNPYR